MKVLYSDAHGQHSPARLLVKGVSTPSREIPRRAEILLDAVRAAGYPVVAPDDFGPEVRASIHTADYLEFLERAHGEWQALGDGAPEVIPNTFPNRHKASKPTSIIGKAGYYMGDLASPIGPGTWLAACGSANCAAHAAALLVDGETAAYALCRPPGHHAFVDMAAGYCFLNNSAIAAQYLRRKYERVAILDVDVHHGNGTQHIFYRRSDVLHVSLHGTPEQLYPFFWGYESERGEGEGEGFNLNLPFPLGSGDEAFLRCARRGLEAIHAFAPGALVVALGLDTQEKDPNGAMAVTTDGFQDIGTEIAELGVPVVFVQEGGYVSPDLGRNLIAVLQGFEGPPRRSSRDARA